MRKIKVLLLPHFVIGKLGKNSFGEAEFFYNAYFKNAEIFTTSAGVKIYIKDDIGMAVTGSGKVNNAMCLTSILSQPDFDFDYIISVGSAGGAYDKTVPGDVIIGTDAVDFDIGHEALDFSDSPIWFHDDSYDDVSYKKLNIALATKVYQITKNTSLKTTKLAKNAMREAFGVTRNPRVKLGAIVSGDNFWKGKTEHEKAIAQCKFYGTASDFCATEMEDIACAKVCESFGKLDSFLAIRAIVNTDVFMPEMTPEKLWDKNNFNENNFNKKIKADNEETFDIFEPAMENLFAVVKTIIDSLPLSLS